MPIRAPALAEQNKPVEQRVLADTEGTDLKRAVVCDDDDITLRRVQCQQPRHHADVVLAVWARRLRQTCPSHPGSNRASSSAASG
ncbi:hypothetical protein ON010_g5565 [Phytophthora cinnamomi]|nr:hypothetical protein ON010_g5565 [Phytophthora cinnamomi]